MATTGSAADPKVTRWAKNEPPGSSVKIYSVYNVKDAVDTLKAVKALGRDPTDDYRAFVRRTAVFVASRIVGPLHVETVITPSSSSTIINDSVDELQRIRPDVEIVRERFQKVLDPGQIRIAEDDPRITPAIVKSLRRVIDNATRDGYFQMKRVRAKDRKFLSNYFSLVDGYRYGKLEGRRVAIMDDLVRTGSSFEEMRRILEQYAPESVVGITLFKSST